MAEKIKSIDYGIPGFKNFGANLAESGMTSGTAPSPAPTSTPAPAPLKATPNSKGNLTLSKGNAALQAEATQSVPPPPQAAPGATTLASAANVPAPTTPAPQPIQSGLFNYAPSVPAQPAPTQSFLDWSRGLTEPQKKAALAMGTSLLKSSAVASPTPISGTYGWGEAIEAGQTAYSSAEKEKEYRDNFKAITGKEPTMNQALDEQAVKDVYEQQKTKRNTETAAKYFKENPQIDSVTIGGDTFNRMNLLGGRGGAGGAGGGMDERWWAGKKMDLAKFYQSSVDKMKSIAPNLTWKTDPSFQQAQIAQTYDDSGNSITLIKDANGQVGVRDSVLGDIPLDQYPQQKADADLRSAGYQGTLVGAKEIKTTSPSKGTPPTPPVTTTPKTISYGGKTYTQADIEHTAKQYGMTTEEVINKLQQGKK